MLVSGASRGIGLSIAQRLAKAGANLILLAKTVTPQATLPGTLHTAAAECRALGAKVCAVQCDIRSEESVAAAVKEGVKEFGGIDICINNASAISLTNTQDTTMKKYDLMHGINSRGTFLVSKYCIPYLKKSKNPHILNISPPLDMQEQWFAPHTAYTSAKFGMSLCVLGMSGELREEGIAVNALWPLTTIATAAVQNLLGGDSLIQASRTSEIMSDAAYAILSTSSRAITGNYFIDEHVLRQIGVKNFEQYNVKPGTKDEELALDFFV